MQDASGYDPNYVMGRSTTETDRLKRQSQLYDASTWQLLKDAGLSDGMKVLDIGSGAGNVSFIAASLVGDAAGSSASTAILSSSRRRRTQLARGASVRFHSGSAISTRWSSKAISMRSSAGSF
jgi:cyclopropane fatty-acyl-phospholipid synthase-like methyltransferase